jgi:hypothetical protein
MKIEHPAIWALLVVFFVFVAYARFVAVRRAIREKKETRYFIRMGLDTFSIVGFWILILCADWTNQLIVSAAVAIILVTTIGGAFYDWREYISERTHRRQLEEEKKKNRELERGES